MRLPSGRRPSRPAVVAVIGTAGLVTGVVLNGAPAMAADPERLQTPIVAGTQLDFPGAKCTAGLILENSGTLSRLTTYQRAVRYVLTAGHCGSLDDNVNVASVGRVGAVTWKSNRSDLALVTIPPNARRREQCSSSSLGITCTIVVDYTPRAVGRLLVQSRGGLIAVDVTGTTPPTGNEQFCTSGQRTGVNCNWATTNVQVPDSGPGVAFAESFARNVEAGDSGGPVYRAGGVVFGIIDAAADPTSEVPDFMSYTLVSQFFAEQSGYRLAAS